MVNIRSFDDLDTSNICSSIRWYHIQVNICLFRSYYEADRFVSTNFAGFCDWQAAAQQQAATQQANSQQGPSEQQMRDDPAKYSEQYRHSMASPEYRKWYYNPHYYDPDGNPINAQQYQELQEQGAYDEHL